MTEPSALEKIASSLPVKLTANVLGTITPLAALVPPLVDFLANQRHAQRVEKMLGELQEIVGRHAEKLKVLSDDQYKVVNEAISAAFYTINQDKLDFLKRVATNAFLDPNAVEGASDSLARAVRDISASEAQFIIRKFNYTKIVVVASENLSEAIKIHEPLKTLAIASQSSDELILSGLISLGLLYSKMPVIGGTSFEWSPLVVKLILLLKDAPPVHQ